MKLTKQQKTFLKTLVDNQQPFRMINLTKKQMKTLMKYLQKLNVSIPGNIKSYYMDTSFSVDTWFNEYHIATPSTWESQQQPIVNLFQNS